jgi:hypothetical protein
MTKCGMIIADYGMVRLITLVAIYLCTERDMQEYVGHERREYVRAPLQVDVEFLIVDADEYIRAKRSVAQCSSSFAGQGGLTLDQVVHDADNAVDSHLIRFLIHMDEKLDTVLKLLSMVAGQESCACKNDNGNAVCFMGQGLEISGAGMSVLCDQTVTAGQILRARFMISRFPVVPLEVFGEVVGAEPVQADGRERYQVVIKFMDMDEDDREKIIAYTFQMQRDAIRRLKRSNHV